MTRLPSEAVRNIGYILHSSIDLPSIARVADVGTGTARFLLHLQPTYPDAVLEGFDISSALYPPPDTLPPNVSLSVRDMKEPFPAEMHGKYDLVHVRMVVAAMLPEEWEPTVWNLVQLLKPGGFLQWEECDFINAEYLQINPDCPVEKTRGIAEQFRTALWTRFQNGWNTLPRQMRAAGLEPIVTDVVESDRVPETRKKVTAGILNLCFTWARLMAERGAPGAMCSEQLDGLEKEVSDEIESGCYFKYRIHVACGRKPSS
ncbi:hypothetical protein PG991_000501 [Apiospora marii]|uniref:Methyltransferase domain-containing protein n=1 Tax=Apiospora marii TaxID=335849 RepID=A0ABR1T4P1_9PEZI